MAVNEARPGDRELERGAEGHSGGWRGLLPWAAGIAAPVVLQGMALFNPDVIILDCEERYNAAHALALLEGHWAELFALQYRAFCGGCTVDALLGLLPLALLPPVFFTWKLVALGWTALAAVTGALALRPHDPRAAGLFLLLLSLCPWNYLRLSLLSWGNHVECGVMGLLLLSLLAGATSRRRRIAAGVVGGIGLWIGFTMGPALVAGAVMVLSRRSPRDARDAAAGLLVAPVAWGLQWLGGGGQPFGTIYRPGEATPSLLRAPEKLMSLIEPQQLAGLFGLPNPAWGVPLGVTMLLSLLAAAGWALRPGGAPPGSPTRAAALFLGVWLAVYLVVGFAIEHPPWPEVGSPSGLRYAAPIYLPAMVLLASAGAALSRRAPRRAALLLAGPLAAGLAARAATFTPPFPTDTPLRLLAADPSYFRLQASYALPRGAHETCAAPAPAAAVHAYALGREAARARLDEGAALDGLAAPDGRPAEPFYEGVGGQTVDTLDGEGQASFLVLTAATRALSRLPPPAAEAAIDEALWRRVYREKEWSLSRGGLDAAALQQSRRLLRSSDPSLRDGWLEAQGRRMARQAARTGEPHRVPFPKADAVGLEPFARGFGDGLGEEWGPAEQVPRPLGLPDALAPALLEGYRRGQSRQWASPLDTLPSLSDATGPDLDADRWWGPAPPMLCPCGSTCE